MNELHVPSVLAEIIDGPVDPVDRVHAFDTLRELCRRAPRAVRRARARLFVERDRGFARPAVAEATLVLDDGVVVSAGAEAATMPEAIEQVAARLGRQLRRLAEPLPPASASLSA